MALGVDGGVGRAEPLAGSFRFDALIAAVGRGQIGPVVDDHRRARPGRVFVAVRGRHVDARAFAVDAARAGCVAVVARGEPPADWAGAAPGCAWVRVGDDRRALSRLAAAQHGDPSHDLGVTAVTGTNGKTTVTYLMEAIWRAQGIVSGRIGTVEIRVADRTYPPAMTTPDPLSLHGWLRRMHRHGVREVAMEASSHALAQRRLDDVAVDVAVLTNVRRDHLDYHGTLRAYRDAKGRLFTRLLGRSPGRGQAFAVLPVADPAAPVFAARTPAQVWWYGVDGEEPVPGAHGPQVRAEGVEMRRWGSRLRLCLPSGTATLDLPLPGRFNVRNAAAAAAAAAARGTPLDAIVAGLSAASGAPGRAEVLYDGEFAIVLDFAHNPDALQEVLAAARPLVGPGGRLLCLMGAEGDKDKGKRPLMGEVAGRLSDLLWVTSDSPRGEDPAQVVAQVAAGARGTRAAVVCDPDRQRSIAAAVRSLGPGDVLVVAGRGPETVQVVGGRRLRWSDAGAVRAALAGRGETREAVGVGGGPGSLPAGERALVPVLAGGIAGPGP